MVPVLLIPSTDLQGHIFSQEGTSITHHQQIMRIRNTLAINIIITIIGCLQGLPTAGVSQLTSIKTPQPMTTSSITSVTAKRDEKSIEKLQTEAKNIFICELILWKLYCRVISNPKVTKSTTTTTQTREPRTTTALNSFLEGLKKTAYNRNRGFLG